MRSRQSLLWRWVIEEYYLVDTFWLCKCCKLETVVNIGAMMLKWFALLFARH